MPGAPRGPSHASAVRVVFRIFPHIPTAQMRGLALTGQMIPAVGAVRIFGLIWFIPPFLW